MHFEFLVEEQSMEVTLRNLLPRLLGPEDDYDVRDFRGCQNLLKQLPHRLRGYRHLLSDEYRIVIVIDRDSHDCEKLKCRLETMAADAGLPTKTSPAADGRFYVVNRIAIEELEAWFFGDIEAVVTAYPRVRSSVATRSSYRYSDEIRGGTAEALHRVLREFGYYRGYFPKIEVASKISEHMDPARNRSPSFRCFVDGVQACLT